ncbi:hypothetical protein C8R43DRAFT_900795 [Mycena crocata]|nr:hypothetical protein C8R43DRAFT_900795 [Mycena crocata]
MESVVELRARIGELGSAISRQKQALRDLEKTKSDAECQLNSILDPMERLPLEISSEIFMLCLPGSHVPHPISVPMVLLAICHAWSDIALSTPLLWTAIDIDSQRTSRFYKLFEVWLARARSLPLTLSLHGSMDPHIHALVKMHAHQVQNLELYICHGNTPLSHIMSQSTLSRQCTSIR